jgi:serine phosphatase RsbU (regulator of sigma subunit)
MINKKKISVFFLILFVLSSLTSFSQTSIDSLLNQLSQTIDKSKKAELCFKLGRSFLIDRSDFKKALSYYNASESYALLAHNDTLYLETLINKYYCYDRLYSSEGIDSNTYLIKKLHSHFPQKNNRLNAKYYVLMGDEQTDNNIENALKYYLEAKKYFMLAGAKNLFAIDQRLIRVYQRTNQYRKSLAVLKPFVNEFKAKKLNKDLSQVYHNIAVAYYNLNNDSCIESFNTSAEFALTTFGDTALYLSDNVLLIDYLILNKNKFNDAEVLLERCKTIMSVYSKPLDKITISNIYGLSGDLYKNKTSLVSGDLTDNKKNTEKAINFYKMGVNEFSPNQFLIPEQTNLEILYKSLSDCYININQTDSALLYYKKSIAIKDTLQYIQSNMDSQELLQKYDAEKKDAQIDLLNEKNKVFDMESRQHKLVIAGVIIIAILSLIALVVFVNRYKLKQNANLALQKQKEIIEQSNAVISQTNKEITRRNNLIEESIDYAAIIQQSILHNEDVLSEKFKESFVINIPKETIGGDFYWVHTSEQTGNTYVAVADCTGHGVAGSLMTLLSHSIFNSIIEKFPDIHVNDFLTETNKKIYTSFNTQKMPHQSVNGMNVSLVCIDKKNNKITYAGAKNSILLAKNNSEIVELKVDLYSIGYLPRYSFSLFETAINPGDQVFLTTDGFYDQIGGSNNKKFLKANLIAELKSLHYKPADYQKAELFKIFINWKGNKEQKDDVCLVSFKIS